MLACNCLNVIIETEDDFQKVTADSLQLSQEEINDRFFKQDVQQVGKLININKSHSALIQARNVGSWAVHYCMNCDVHSHAIHREKGASCVLVNSKLLAKESIEKLRQSSKFSQLYKIVIDTEDYAEDDIISNSYYPNEVESVIKGLKIIAAEVLKTEARAVEERIKQFSDEQYSKLSDLRERAFREQHMLTKIILFNNVTIDTSKPASTNSGISPNPQGMPSRMNEPLAAGRDTISPRSPNSLNSSARHTPKRQKSLVSGQMVSLDRERLFEFDGIDDIQSGEESELVESDLDEPREDPAVRRQQRQRGNMSSMAKSLPMTIPVFLPQARRTRNFDEFDDSNVPIENNLDIAASIKALAKSVHGDAVFGELPKPRYPNYI